MTPSGASLKGGGIMSDKFQSESGQNICWSVRCLLWFNVIRLIFSLFPSLYFFRMDMIMIMVLQRVRIILAAIRKNNMGCGVCSICCAKLVSFSSSSFSNNSVVLLGPHSSVPTSTLSNSVTLNLANMALPVRFSGVDIKAPHSKKPGSIP